MRKHRPWLVSPEGHILLCLLVILDQDGEGDGGFSLRVPPRGGGRCLQWLPIQLRDHAVEGSGIIKSLRLTKRGVHLWWALSEPRKRIHPQNQISHPVFSRSPGNYRLRSLCTGLVAQYSVCDPSKGPIFRGPECSYIGGARKSPKSIWSSCWLTLGPIGAHTRVPHPLNTSWFNTCLRVSMRAKTRTSLRNMFGVPKKCRDVGQRRRAQSVWSKI